MKITIENHDGRLRLRWIYQGKRHTMAIAINDDPTGRAVAKRKASEIEFDIQVGHFDPTLLKYKPKTIGKNATEITAPELFQKYIQYLIKEKGLTPRSISGRYRPLYIVLTRGLEKAIYIPFAVFYCYYPFGYTLLFIACNPFSHLPLSFPPLSRSMLLQQS